MLIDNFEQHFVNCVLNVQNTQKSAQKHKNRLNTSKNGNWKNWKNYGNFAWFLGFRICCMVKNENPETLEINRKLSKSIKHPVLTVYRY